LPALSGIAQKIHERIGGEYLAGIWSTGLLEGLLWRSLDIMPLIRRPRYPLQIKPTSRRRPDTPSAPSWSWASVLLDDAEIIFLHQGNRAMPEMTILAEDLRLEVEENNLNPYGQVAGGTLKMRTAIYSARSRAFEIGSEEYFTHLNLLDDASGDVIGRADFDETIWPTERFYCAPLVYPPELKWTFGLLLAPKAEGVYTRIGRFNIQRSDIFDNCERKMITVI
jgi:hypothetical protein